MAEDRKGRETRPRDEDFEVDSSYSPYETVKKKDYREKPGIVMAILGSGVVLAFLAVLLYSLLKQNQWTIITTAQTNVTQEEYSDLNTSEAGDTEETPPGISEKTRAADKDRTREEENASEETEPSGEGSAEEETGESETVPEDTEGSADAENTDEPTPGEVVTDPSVPEDTAGPETPPEGAGSSAEGGEAPPPEEAGEERTYQDIEYEGLLYRVENGIASVAANRCNNSRIEVASDVFGYPVQGIDDNAFRGSVNVSLIIIPEGVDWISAGAFAECPNLLQVVIPDSVSGINEAAFGPNSSVTIEASAGSFAHNYALNKGMNWIEKAS